jgi:hypothetical protein
MKNVVRYIAIVLILATSLVYYAPDAQALVWRTTTRYYDAGCNQIGWRIVSCTGAVTSSGSQTGVWKEMQYDECAGDGPIIETYHNCSGAWVPVGYVGDPAC